MAAKKEIEDMIVHLRTVEKLTINEIRVKVNLSREIVHGILKKHDLIGTPSERAAKYDRKYQDYFGNGIDSKEKAYVFGILLSIASIKEDVNKVQIGFNNKKIIEKIMTLIGAEDQAIFTIDRSKDGWKDGYFLILSSKEFCKNLINLGLVSNKKYDFRGENLPKILSENREYFKSFLMGVYDCKGSLTYQQTCNKWYLSFSSNKEYLTYLSANILKHFDIKMNMGKQSISSINNNSATLRVGGTTWPCKILETFYGFPDKMEPFFDKEKFILFANLYLYVHKIPKSHLLENIIDGGNIQNNIACENYFEKGILTEEQAYIFGVFVHSLKYSEEGVVIIETNNTSGLHAIKNVKRILGITSEIKTTKVLRDEIHSLHIVSVKFCSDLKKKILKENFRFIPWNTTYKSLTRAFLVGMLDSVRWSEKSKLIIEFFDTPEMCTSIWFAVIMLSEIRLDFKKITKFLYTVKYDGNAAEFMKLIFGEDLKEYKKYGSSFVCEIFGF